MAQKKSNDKQVAVFKVFLPPLSINSVYLFPANNLSAMRALYASLAAILILSCSCSRDKAVVSGRIGTHKDTKVYLEKVMPGKVTVVDSTATGSNGRFKFRTATESTPTIFNLRTADGYASILLAPGERAKFKAEGKLPGDYTVEGSEGSERMRELWLIMSSGVHKLDSLKRAFDKAGEKERGAVSAQYARQYFASKQEQIRFILSDPSSIASVYALYQKLPSDQLVDNDRNTVYFQMVADSAGARYPSSPYVAALKGMVARRESKQGVSTMINEKLAGETDKYPDIEMTDIYGNRHRLSDLNGKVIILDFWSSALPGSAMNNAEMKALYKKYSDRGLEIYQVSADEVKHSWVAAVTAQQLPWISVSDLRGTESPAISRYNIRSLPANFVIGRDGNIVGKNLFGDELERIVKNLI